MSRVQWRSSMGIVLLGGRVASLEVGLCLTVMAMARLLILCVVHSEMLPRAVVDFTMMWRLMSVVRRGARAPSRRITGAYCSWEAETEIRERVWRMTSLSLSLPARCRGGEKCDTLEPGSFKHGSQDVEGP